MVWIVWGQGGLGALGIGGVIVVPFLPSTIFLACMNWAVGALPVVVLRKVYLTGETFVDPCSWNVWYRWELPISGSNPSHFLDHTKASFYLRTSMFAPLLFYAFRNSPYACPLLNGPVFYNTQVALKFS